MQDMNEEEKAIMQQHEAYWKELLDKGIVIVYGPVMDPRGGYGIGVIEAENEEQVKQLTANDPANKINRYKIFPMRAITPKK
ncbi:MAG: YciI family protein [Bacteroidia bacterium]